jgi:hypothetical protein
VSAEAPAIERAHPRELPQPLTLVFWALTAIGLLAFVAGLVTDAETTWRAYHVNFLYFAGLSQGGLVIACIFVIVGARWPGPIHRIAEGLAAWVPITFLLACLQFLGKQHIYTNWIDGPPPAKAAYLTIPRLYIMDLAFLGVLAVLTLVFLRSSLRPTLHGVAERAVAAKGMFESWTAGWRGDEAEKSATADRLRVIAPIICLLYAFGYSFLAFDQVMSLSPTWFSNLFGAYFAWGGFLTAVSATALIAVLLRHSPGFEGQITKARMHDIGKMIFAFSIFWMYLFYAQYLVIWYGNLPEETFFLQARLGSQFMQDTRYFVAERLNEPYVKLTLTVWAFCWIVPFFVLLGQKPKKTPAILGTVAAIVCLGFWLERNTLVWPSLAPDDGSAWFGAIQLGVAAGFLGAYGLVYVYYARVFPSLAVPERP